MISLQSSNYFLPHSIPLLIAAAVTITWTYIFQNTSICFPNEMHAYHYDPQVRATYATVLFKHCYFCGKNWNSQICHELRMTVSHCAATAGSCSAAIVLLD